MAKEYNLELFKFEHRVEGLINGLEDELAPILEDSLERVEAKIIKLAEKAGDAEAISKARGYLNAQRSAIAKVLEDVYKDIGKIIEEKAVEVGQAAPELSKKMLLECIVSPEVGLALKKILRVPELSKDKLLSYLRSTKIEGLYFNEWLKKLEEGTVAKIIRETQVGLVLGEAYGKIGKRLQNTLSISRRSAHGLAHNAMFQALRFAQAEYHEANKEHIKVMKFMTELDARTCEICIPLDQKEYPVDSYPLPPLHWKCRCSVRPVWKDLVVDGKEILLDREISGDRIVRVESNPRWIQHKDGTRSRVYQDYDVSFVRGDMSYNQMLSLMAKSKDPAHRAFAKEVLGPTRFDLVAEGKLKIESLYYHGKLKTIEELGEMV